MSKNVTIPLGLLKTLIALFEHWDISLYDRVVQDDYWDALWSLKLKLLKLDIHDAYSMIVKAPNEDARDIARIEYLRLKRQLESYVASGVF